MTGVEEDLCVRIGDAELIEFLVPVGNGEIKICQYFQEMTDSKNDILYYQDLPKGFTLWPNSVLLSKWLFSNSNIISGRSVLELGCGVGLPGIVCAKILDAHSVILTDGDEKVLPLVTMNVCRNESSDKCKVERLSWGKDASLSLSSQDPVDIILAAECIYEAPHISLLLETVNQVLSLNGRLILTMKERSSDLLIRLESTLDQFHLMIERKVQLEKANENHWLYVILHDLKE